MKIKNINKLLLFLFLISSIVTGIFLIYKFSKKDYYLVENNKEVIYKKVKINSKDLYKITKIGNDNKYNFILPNFEYYMLKNIFIKYPELVNNEISFSTNDIKNPTSITIRINTTSEIIWNYSII